jgi:hypothetical protein
MPSTTESAVIGMAMGYGRKQVQHFSQSLRRTGFQGKLILFVGDVPTEQRAELESLADRVINATQYLGAPAQDLLTRNSANVLGRIKGSRRFKRFYPSLFHLAVSMRGRGDRRMMVWRSMEEKLEGWIGLRHFVYRNYLKENHHDLVLLSDVRDVLFQDDPFADPLRAELEICLEAKRLPIGECPYNQFFLNALYGTQAAQSLADKPIACAGTVRGTSDGVKRYLIRTTQHIEQLWRPIGMCDQGMHNYLYWTGALEPAAVYENGHGPVYTAGNELSVFTDAGFVRNDDGSIPAIVHQYDRHPALALQMLHALGSAPR